MKNYTYIGIAMVGVLSVSTANAQVLGGNATGALGGTLSGGMRDMNVITQGSGSFGGSFETDPLSRASDITGRATSRVRNSTDTVRERTQSTVGRVRAKGESAATRTAGTAASGVDGAAEAARQVNTTTSTTTSAAGSLASDVDVAGGEAAAATNAAHQQQLMAVPAVDPAAGPKADAVSGLTDSGLDRDLMSQEGTSGTDGSSGHAPSQSLLPAQGSLSNALDHGATAQQGTATDSNASPALGLDGGGSGAANGSLAASKRGASASAAGETNGSANASLRR